MPTIILGLDVRDVQEPVAAHREIHKCGLNGRLEIDHPPLVDIPRITLVARPLDIQLLENPVFDDRDPAFLGLEYIDQHFFFHAVGLSVAAAACVGLRPISFCFV
jgi:hypothetical protein